MADASRAPPPCDSNATRAERIDIVVATPLAPTNLLIGEHLLKRLTPSRRLPESRGPLGYSWREEPWT
jgi:hypothetical protein